MRGGDGAAIGVSDEWRSSLELCDAGLALPSPSSRTGPYDRTEYSSKVALIGKATLQRNRADTVVRVLQPFTCTLNALLHEPAVRRRAQTGLEGFFEIAA